MRNSNRSQRRSGPAGDHRDAGNVAGVGELRAVAERLLETGTHYLEQGRAWLHAATRREQDDRREEPYGPGAGGYGPRAAFRPEHDGPDADDWSAQGQSSRERGPYAPDEYSFSATGGSPEARHRAGYDYDDHRSREFDARAEDLARHRGRDFDAGSGRRHPGWRGALDAEAYLPGSYGYGGEGRMQSGAEASARGDHHHAHGSSGFAQASGRWERAYTAQGQGSHRGRGPRGYARSDERILEDVNERLCDDPIVDATDIEVRCTQGCVVLEGKVPTRWMKHRAEDIADSASGVKDVENRIRVVAEEPASQGDFDTSRPSNSAATGTGASTASSESPAKTGTGKQRQARTDDTTTTGTQPQQPQAPH